MNFGSLAQMNRILCTHVLIRWHPTPVYTEPFLRFVLQEWQWAAGVLRKRGAAWLDKRHDFWEKVEGIDMCRDEWEIVD